MNFAFTVYDANDGTELGGGHYYNVADAEAGIKIVYDEFQRHNPKRELHVEQIPVERYEAGYNFA